MRLKSAHIENFRCVEDSGEFTVSNVTCLVGKNESGKTSLLTALYRLNPYDDDDGEFDREQDYPRRKLVDYDELHGDQDARVVVTKWALDDGDINAAKALVGDSAFNLTEVTVTRTYEEDQTNEWDVDVDEPTAIAHLIDTSLLHAEEKSALGDLASVAQLKKHLAALGDKSTDRHQKLLDHLNKNFKAGSASLGVIDLLAGRMPKFVYFSQYDLMPGQVSLTELTRDKAKQKFRVFLSFLELARISIDDVAKIDKFESLIARLEAASIKISKEIFDFWSQNKHLKVEVRIDEGRAGDPAPYNTGQIVRLRIRNTHHDVTVSFDDRSTGFVWFFSFLVLFSRLKSSLGRNLIVLLDEPGLSLHAKAQQDLLRYIHERLKPDHQVLYTTHSPFMIPADDLLSVRTVEDVVKSDGNGRIEILGTKVGDRVLSTDRDTLFPLQSALGYEITQTLFVGKYTLLVEGPSDLLYLTVFSSLLAERKRESLDRRWTICPAGGVDKVAAFLSLFGGQKLNIASLVDLAQGQKNKVEDLRRHALLNAGHVFSADQYSGQTEADVEDIIGRKNYIAIVNAAFELPKKQQLPSDKPKGAPERCVKEVEQAFAVLPPDAPNFDHYRPAAFLAENPKVAKELPELDAALDRFEKLFKEINVLLPQAASSRA
ncbi:MAG TPA: AAA family ATPase [Tepidisphaeraceae bacterium]|nr:AAA family ATPase [Tepidisphaeraceae bacterium]